MDFRTTYEKVKWIVWKCKKIIIFICGNIVIGSKKECWFYTNFCLKKKGLKTMKKTLSLFQNKFRNHIHDKIRKQESQKRKLDRQPYEEVSEIGHRLKSKELFLDELVAFREAIDNLKELLMMSDWITTSD